ncbi:ESPR-type extended signal peptide-containing protein [Moraxella lacunata]
MNHIYRVVFNHATEPHPKS